MKWIIWTIGWFLVCAVEQRWHDRTGFPTKVDIGRVFLSLVCWIIWFVGMWKFW